MQPQLRDQNFGENFLMYVESLSCSAPKFCSATADLPPLRADSKGVRGPVTGDWRKARLITIYAKMVKTSNHVKIESEVNLKEQ
jgi:hypothetical protein